MSETKNTQTTVEINTELNDLEHAAIKATENIARAESMKLTSFAQQIRRERRAIVAKIEDLERQLESRMTIIVCPICDASIARPDADAANALYLVHLDSH